MDRSCEQSRAGCEQEKDRIRSVDLVQCQNELEGLARPQGDHRTPSHSAACHQDRCDFACVCGAGTLSHSYLCDLMPFCFSITIRAAVVSLPTNNQPTI